MTNETHNDPLKSDYEEKVMPPPKAAGRLIPIIGAVFLVLVSGLGGTCLAKWLRPPVAEEAAHTVGLSLPPALARWKKPDLTLILTGQQYGYLLPCGCSRPQVGGLERRYNYLATLREAGWPLTAVDLGDIAQKQGLGHLSNQQGLIKYRYSMESLKKMGYSAVSLGLSEAKLNIFKILGEYALNDPDPKVLVANLSNKETEFPEQVFETALVQAKGSTIKVGVTAVVGPTVSKAMKDSIAQFGSSKDALTKALKSFAEQKTDLKVLLYQGAMGTVANDDSEPIAAAKAFPAFDVILCVCDEDEPPSEPLEVKHANGHMTRIIRMGHKGKYVGTLGVWKTPMGLEFKYHLQDLGEQWLTPEGGIAGHPVLELMERYAKEVERGDYLGKTAQSTHPFSASVPDSTPTFVGSDKCKKCHEEAYKVWETSGHGHGWQTLADAKKPGLRHKDPECILCHTVGFGYKTGFVDEVRTPKLKDVGCESCHGPSSEHLKSTSDETWHKLMNPWKAKEKETGPETKIRIQRIDQFCQTCHDMENDVNWVHQGFAKKWPKIAHPTPLEKK